MRLKQRLYFNEDRSRVVNEHDPSGRYLLGDIGTEIPDSLAKKYGLFPSGLLPAKKQPEPDKELDPIEKSVEPVENKMVESVPNKKVRKTSGLTIKKLPDNESKGE